MAKKTPAVPVWSMVPYAAESQKKTLIKVLQNALIYVQGGHGGTLYPP
jgi:hypothetical protein